jgi:hypothetical protein
MRTIYHGLVLFFAVQVAAALMREKTFWKQAGAALVLVLFLLRLFLIQ